MAKRSEAKSSNKGFVSKNRCFELGWPPTKSVSVQCRKTDTFCRFYRFFSTLQKPTRKISGTDTLSVFWRFFCRFLVRIFVKIAQNISEFLIFESQFWCFWRLLKKLYDFDAELRFALAVFSPNIIGQLTSHLSRKVNDEISPSWAKKTKAEWQTIRQSFSSDESCCRQQKHGSL